MVSEVQSLPPSPCVSPHNLGPVWQIKTCTTLSLQILGKLQPLFNLISGCKLLPLLHTKDLCSEPVPCLYIGNWYSLRVIEDPVHTMPGVESHQSAQRQQNRERQQHRERREQEQVSPDLRHVPSSQLQRYLPNPLSPIES